eukprot:15458841-Alexandrium_andersonii.AAC.2
MSCFRRRRHFITSLSAQLVHAKCAPAQVRGEVCEASASALFLAPAAAHARPLWRLWGGARAPDPHVDSGEDVPSPLRAGADMPR